MPTVHYDYWKLSTPWDDCDIEEVVVSECCQCRSDLYEGQDVVTDGEGYFCDRDCFRDYARSNPQEFIQAFDPNTKRVRRWKKWFKRNINRFMDEIDQFVETRELG